MAVQAQIALDIGYKIFASS